MTERGLNREAAQLRERLGPRLCAHPAPCGILVTTEIVLLPGGREERHGEAPPPLCEACPLREERNRPVRHIEVVRDLRNRHGGRDHESATRRATLPAARFDGDEGEDDTSASTAAPTAPDDGLVLPAAFGPDHPARLIAEGREPEPPRRAKPPGRRSDETPRIDPRDFGL